MSILFYKKEKFSEATCPTEYPCGIPTGIIKIVEKKFGRTLKVPLHTEEAAFGAALYGLVCCGIYKNAREVQKLISYIE